MKGRTHVGWSWEWTKRSGVTEWETLKGPENHKEGWDIKLVERVTCIRKMKVAYDILIRSPQGRRRRCGHEEKINIYFKEANCEDVD
jgi:hypothetical protein